jgi:predicted transcriptional regulator
LASAKGQDFMRIHFTRLHLGDIMQTAFDLLKRNGESNFLVFDSLGYISGTLPAQFILAAAAQHKLPESCSQWMSDNMLFIQATDTLKEAYERMNKNGAAILAVRDSEDTILGVIDRDAITRAISVLT